MQKLRTIYLSCGLWFEPKTWSWDFAIEHNPEDRERGYDEDLTVYRLDLGHILLAIEFYWVAKVKRYNEQTQEG